MEELNYYKNLKIDKDVNITAIKKAFRTQIAIYHPDNNPTPNANLQFDALVEAFHVLSNPERRKAYDEILNSSENDTLQIVEPIQEYQVKEWKTTSQKKSKTYKDYSLAELLVMDVFTEAAFEGLFSLGGNLLEGLGESLGDIF